MYWCLACITCKNLNRHPRTLETKRKVTFFWWFDGTKGEGYHQELVLFHMLQTENHINDLNILARFKNGLVLWRDSRFYTSKTRTSWYFDLSLNKIFSTSNKCASPARENFSEGRVSSGYYWIKICNKINLKMKRCHKWNTQMMIIELNIEYLATWDCWSTFFCRLYLQLVT